MKHEERDMCIYCGKWFPIEEIKRLPLPTGDQRKTYCPGCYPDVLEAHRKLPWNQK